MKSADRGCYFCGAKPRTKEHILPNWLGKALPNWKSSWLNKHEYPDTGAPALTSKTFGTSLLRKTVKETCGPCNNGWMSRLESDVREILSRLFSGAPMILSEPDIATFLRWCVKTHMMRTQLDDQGFPFPMRERVAIMKGDPASAAWTVWIGRTYLDGARHRNWSIVLGEGDENDVLLSQTTLSMGSFLIAVSYISDPQARDGFLQAANSMAVSSALPLAGLSLADRFFVWPPEHALTEAQCYYLSDFLRLWTNMYWGLDRPLIPNPAPPFGS